MGAFGCAQTVNVLNFLFDPRVIRNEREQLQARLVRGDDLASVLVGLGAKFKRFNRAGRLEEIESVVKNWPPEQLEAIRAVVTWALSSLDSESPIRLRWKGDAEYHETVTKFEVRDGEITIEFAHPPVEAVRLTA